MNHHQPESTNPNEDIEQQILLRSSQELPSSEAARLDSLLAGDTEAGAFAKFIHETLPAATKAPRDFAAEAIYATMAPRDFAAVAIATAAPSASVLLFPHFRKVAAAAAAVILVGMFIAQQSHHTLSDTIIAGDPSPPTSRLTAQISNRLDALESDLTQSRSRLTNGRYHRSTSL
jgi:hypothetical protein